jgi:tetratricopeptide (TPR) repeat protein
VYPVGDGHEGARAAAQDEKVAMAGFKFQVFLSHSSGDKAAVEELAVRLRREGIEPWLDKWNLVPGDPWQPAVERALDECATCAVVIGPGGFGGWQNEEMRAAIARRASEGQGGFRVIPVLLPGVDRPERGKLPAFLLASTWVEFRRSLDEADAFRRLICGIQGQEPGVGPGGAVFEGACPYRGLEVFDVEHAPFYFGREALTEWLINELRLKASGEENRFLAVLGASGSGKSSLARAGLVAALKKGALESSVKWPIVVLKPGRAPLESLSVALAGLPGGAALIKDTRDLLNIKAFGDDPKSLHTFARLALRGEPRSRRLCLLVDQLEEVFTLCEDEAIRCAFFDNLRYAGTIADGQAIVVVTMRADFYGRCASYAALAAAISDHQLLVGPMNEDELGRAIERPARLAGGEFEPGLVAMLLKDVKGQAGALPLLEFTLLELWGQREGRRLTVGAYRALGELQGALENRADHVLRQFDAAHREICRRIFLRLTQPGEGSEDTKRRASFRELVPAGTDPMAVEGVVRRLADARLIITECDPKTASLVSIEVSHEALIRGWAQLRDWIDADRAGLLLQRQVTEAAREWQANGRESSFLFSGSRLVEAREWAKTDAALLDAQEEAFLHAGVRRRLLGKIVVAASIFLVAASAFSAWEWNRVQGMNQFRGVSSGVDKSVEEAGHLAGDSRWALAIKRLEGAQVALESGSGAEYERIRSRVESLLVLYKKKEDERQAKERDGRAVQAFDQARLLGTAINKDNYDWKAVFTSYRTIFQENGIDIEALPEATVAELIRQQPAMVHEAMVVTLDHWAASTVAPEDSRLRAIARGADTDPLRNAIRDADARKDRVGLCKLAHDPELDRQPAMTTSHLANALWRVHEFNEVVELRRRAQRRDPQDFWTNNYLAWALENTVPAQLEEAIRFYSAALALRAGSPIANYNLGRALLENGRSEEAFSYLDEAINLQPSAIAYVWRGSAWLAKKDFDKAITDLNKAVALGPRYAFAYSSRGYAWYAKKEYDKAFADYNKAIELDPSHAAAYQNRGYAWHTKREYDKAIADYDKAIELDPKFVMAYSGRGNVWYDEKSFDKAIADYDKAIELDPRLATTYHNRGNAWYGKKAFDKAIADCDKAIEIDPEFAPAYSNRASAWFEKKAYDKAIADCDKAIEIDPKHVVAFQRRGNALHAKMEYDKAIADFGKAVEIDPKNATTYFYGGNAWLAKNESDKAIAEFTKAIEIDPKIAIVYSNRGDAWVDKKAYDKAIADYGKAIEIEPTNLAAHYRRGKAWQAKEEYDKAFKDFNKAIALDPRNAVAYCYRGNGWHARKQYEKAFADYDKAIALDSADAVAFHCRGIAWSGRKAYDKAIADFDKAIGLNSKYAAAYVSRGNAWIALRAYDKAIADCTKAIEINPTLAVAYIDRGFAWNAGKQHEKAIADYNKAIGIDPSNAAAYNDRGHAWYAMRAFEKAIADYDTAIEIDPRHATAYDGRGRAWSAQGAYEKAIADYSTAIELLPEFASPYIDRGNARYAMKAFDKAIADYSKAIEIDPGHTAAYNNRGRVWYAMGAFDKSIADCDRAIAVDHGDGAAYYNRGIVRYVKREYDKAIADFDKAIRLHHGLPTAFAHRGRCWNAKREYDKAIADLDKAIELDPKYGWAHDIRGDTHARRREYALAIAEYDKAIELNPKLATAYRSRSRILASCPDEKYRDGKKAIESAIRACELMNWESAGSLEALAAAYAEAGDFEAAVKRQERALALLPKNSDQRLKDFETRLKLFQAKQPYHHGSADEHADLESERPFDE